MAFMSVNSVVNILKASVGQLPVDFAIISRDFIVLAACEFG